MGTGTATDLLFIHHYLTICILLLSAVCGYFSDTRDSKVGARKPGLEVGSVFGLTRCENGLVTAGFGMSWNSRDCCVCVDSWSIAGIGLVATLVGIGPARSADPPKGSASSIQDPTFYLNVETELLGGWQHGVARFVSNARAFRAGGATTRKALGWPFAADHAGTTDQTSFRNRRL